MNHDDKVTTLTRKTTRKKSRKPVRGTAGSLVVDRDLNLPGVTILRVGKKGAKVERRAGAGTVIEQSVYGHDGRLKTVFTIDAGSATLGSDLQYAFERNVAKARRENKKKLGRSDARIANR